MIFTIFLDSEEPEIENPTLFNDVIVNNNDLLGYFKTMKKELLLNLNKMLPRLSEIEENFNNVNLDIKTHAFSQNDTDMAAFEPECKVSEVDLADSESKVNGTTVAEYG